MKTSLRFSLGLVLGAVIVIGPIPAEGQVVAPKVDRQKLAVVALPDLVLEGLTVNPEPVPSTDMYFHLRFRVTVKNVGQAPVDKPFSVAFQYYHPTQSSWQGENDKNNCFAVTETLAPGGRWVKAGYLRVLKPMLAGQSLRVRALADFACDMEFPPKNGLIAERDETNNASNEVVIPGTGLYQANLRGLSPSMALRGGDKVTLSGVSFGAQPGDHTVVIREGDNRVALAAQSWSEGVITFVVPASVKSGSYVIYIGDKTGLQPVSNLLSLKVLQTVEIPWDLIVEGWRVFGKDVSIRLHNWSGGPEPRNASWLAMPQKGRIDLEKVELSVATGHYRFLVNEFRSASVLLSKEGCGANQLRLEIPFESQGRELIGYFKALGPAGEWRRTGAPDVQVNNAKVSALLTFVPKDNTLDYTAAATFEADIRSSNPVWNAILNAFVSDWDRRVRRQVVEAVNTEFNSAGTKERLINELTGKIQGTLFGSSGRTIARFRFLSTAIEIAYY
jgi:hypothetical protein